jgi:serine O-acetyltransferase
MPETSHSETGSTNADLRQRVGQRIRADWFRVFGSAEITPKRIAAAWRTPGLRYMTAFRVVQGYPKSHPLGLIGRLMLRRETRLWGFQIPPQVEIGAGFYIGHFGTVVVNHAARFGSNCNIAHNVTVGQQNRGSRKGAPRIGNNVWIGTGAIVVGCIEVGDNVLIAPGSYVNADVPANSLVMGNPATIHPKTETVVAGYIDNTVAIA